MSGFEIAGLVLGALPVAIAVLDGLKEMNRGVAFWRGIRRRHKRLVSDLDFQRLSFELNLKQLLLPLVLDDDAIRALLKTPGGPEWKRSDVEDGLKRRLGSSYQCYLSIMEALEQVVKELNNELGLDSAAVQAALQRGQSTQSLTELFSKESMSFQVYRVKLSTDGGATAKKLLDELAQRNAQLENLLSQTDRVTQLSQQRDQGALGGASAKHDALLSFWKSAASLYNILQTLWTGCSCPREHATSILLQHPEAAKKARFEMLLAASDGKQLWKLYWALVTAGEDKTKEVSPPPKTAVGPEVQAVQGNPGTHQPGHRLVRLLKSAMRSKAVVREPGTKPVSTATLVPPGVIQAVQITDLCKALHCDARGPACAGFLQCPEDDDVRYFLYPQSRQEAPNFKFITLEQLISERELPPLSFRQRLFLSMTLASSFLQLLESPWIRHQWTKADIIFFPDPARPDSFLLEKPHIKGPTAAAAAAAAATARNIDQGVRKETAGQKSAANEDKRQESLSRLGVVLEELCFRCSVEKRRLRRGYPVARTAQEQQLVDIALGVDWLREISSEAAGLEYEGAVKWCLVDNRIAAGRSDSWRKEMLTHVVAPLGRSYQQFTAGGV